MKKIIFTNEQEQEIINDYVNNHLSLRIIGEKFGVSRGVITRIVKKYDIEIRTGNHTYYSDYDKFKTIDSAEKAYWLGFIAADGCVYLRETNGSIIINIHRKDKEHLEKLKIFMNSNVNIVDHVQDAGFSNKSGMSKITFNSLSMVNDFIELGVPPRKSLILQPPLIDEKFFLPYILGYFDGDGSIFQFNNNTEWGINIVGTKEILEWINNILSITTSLEKKNEDGKNNYYIRCGGIQKPYEILKKLYDSVDVHLDRKYQKFKELETVVFNRNIKNY